MKCDTLFGLYHLMILTNILVVYDVLYLSMFVSQMKVLKINLLTQMFADRITKMTSVALEICYVKTYNAVDHNIKLLEG